VILILVVVPLVPLLLLPGLVFTNLVLSSSSSSSSRSSQQVAPSFVGGGGVNAATGIFSSSCWRVARDVDAGGRNHDFVLVMWQCSEGVVVPVTKVGHVEF